MRQKPISLAAVALLSATLLASDAATAGPEKIGFPTGYQTGWVRYGAIDRYDAKTVRMLYMNPEAWEKARAGQPLPDGAYLVLESRPAKLGSDGQPLKDAQGRFIPDDKPTGLFVQQKRVGWGAEYPPDLRNGEWEYAVFAPDGTRREADVKPCFSCHKPRAATDYTFVITEVLKNVNKK